MKIVKGFFRTIIGLIFGILAGMAIVPAVAAFADAETGAGPTWPVWLVVAAGCVLGLFAPTIRRAFGRGFLVLGTAVLALPLSMMLLSSRTANDMMAASEGASSAEQMGTAIGSGLASIAVTGVSAIVGFFLGAIFIIIGLVLALGGRREVIVVDRAQ